jgi:hypothetical protein
MQNTGDGAEYREMSAKCQNCLDYADYIEKIWADGGYVKTKGWTIINARTSKPTTQGSIDVTLTIEAPPTEYKESADSPVLHHTGGTADYIVTVKQVDGSFSVLTFAQVAA